MNKRDDITAEDIRALMGSAWNISGEEIPEDAQFNTFPYWDSMGHVNLLVHLEQVYEISITYETIKELTSIPAIVEYLREENRA